MSFIWKEECLFCQRFRKFLGIQEETISQLSHKMPFIWKEECLFCQKIVQIFGNSGRHQTSAFNLNLSKKLYLLLSPPPCADIQVCSVCPLKTSCKFVNQSVWKGDNKNLNLAVVMRVITLYALESVPLESVVPEEVKDSVNRLLKQVLSLSQTPA